MPFRALALITLIGLALAGCGQEPAAPEDPYRSALPERGWLETCAHPDRGADRTRCTDAPILWVVAFESRETPTEITAILGPLDEGVSVRISLASALNAEVEQIRGRTFFLRGRATAARDPDGIPSVRVSGGEVLGFQTLVEGPKQGPFAPDMTLAEFGRYCLLAPHSTYTEQCAGRRVLWYGLLRGTAPDGVIVGLPFDGASIARVKTAAPLTWPVGDTHALANQPVVITGILGPYQARRDNSEPVPVINDARIINFAQRLEPVEEITGAQ